VAFSEKFAAVRWWLLPKVWYLLEDAINWSQSSTLYAQLKQVVPVHKYI